MKSKILIKPFLLLTMLSSSTLAVVNPPIIVDNTNNGGAGSLHDALDQANLDPGFDTIEFNIPGAGPHVIQPVVPLPVITEALHINGYTQPGTSKATAANAATLEVVLDGSALALSGIGLQILTDDTQIQGLVIKNFSSQGVFLLGDNHTLRGNYIGTGRRGLAARPNQSGILVSGDGNEIGGLLPRQLNLVSGNEQCGIVLDGQFNIVHGNIIGLDSSGTADLGNGDCGIQIEADNNLVGGYDEGAGNTISGNAIGVKIDLGEANQVQGNYIGTDRAGNGGIGLGNITGIIVGEFASGNMLGNDEPGAGNLVSNNIGFGMEVRGRDNLVQGNLIGTNADGSSAIPNGSSGIWLVGEGNTIGGTSEDSRNIISGNDSSGILVQSAGNDKPVGNTIQGNYIGTDVTGNAALANAGSGIFVSDADENLVGGFDDDAGNLISGNGADGILIRSFNTTSSNNLVLGNLIGTDTSGVMALPNTASGLRITESDGNRIGSIVPGGGNTIAWNGENGVTVESGVHNGIFGNSIVDNSALGIDLNNDGVTANDFGDVDAGANNLQNFVTINSAVVDATSITVDASLATSPLTQFRVEFFASSSCDPSGHGEGERYIGMATGITDIFGNASGSQSFSVIVPAGEQITATVSVIDSTVSPFPIDTSEFSECETSVS